jgi:hypothetical protein
MRRIAFAAIVLAGTVIGTAASAADPFTAWVAAVHRQCPARHLDSMTDGGFDEMFGAFEATLDRKTLRRARTAERRRFDCPTSRSLATCEMSDGFAAYQDVGLIDRFAEFACTAYRCDEAADCVRVAPVRRVPRPAG